MIRISKQTDYGIVLLSLMVDESTASQRYNARHLSERSQIPMPMVQKILKILSRQGLLASQRGANGGYHLARAASEIPVLSVIEAFEGPLALTECCGEHETHVCAMESCCSVRDHWHVINRAVRGALQGISLLDMCSSQKAASDPLRTAQAVAKSLNLIEGLPSAS